MKKSVLLQFGQGSAEEVIAHAMWQRSRGRRPSMSFVGEKNPQKALNVAKAVVDAATRTRMIDSIGDIVMKNKTYHEMTDDEIEIAARNIIITSSSEEEVHQRLLDELDYSGMELSTNIPEDATGREARELVRGLGGMIMKNGAMAMAMMEGHSGLIFL
jgi:hypothetical protein